MKLDTMNLKDFVFLYVALFINIGFYFNEHILSLLLAISIIISMFELSMLHIAQSLKLLSKGLEYLVDEKTEEIEKVEDVTEASKIEELPDDYEECEECET